jgi:hypothetical protein
MGVQPAWQTRLPARAQQVVELASQALRVWRSAFPAKSEDELRLERKIRAAVLRGDLHWSVLNDLKQGKPIQPEQMAALNDSS